MGREMVSVSCRAYINQPCDNSYHAHSNGLHRYDYHGECDLVMLHAPNFGNGLGLDTHIRTTIRYDYSFISSAAIMIGEDVLEVESWGDYMLNGISQAALPAEMSGYTLTKTQTSDKESVFDIQYDSGKHIYLSTFKDFVGVKFDVFNRTELLGSEGLFGEFPSGKMVGRDGKTVIANPNEFGQEWMVLDTEPKLFQVNRFPQHPQKCNLPDPSKQTARRRLGETVARGAAEEACVHWGHDKDMCVMDVMATGDIEVAQMTHMFL